jgi:hypothetical protein
MRRIDRTGRFKGDYWRNAQFQSRQFGMSGSDTANVYLANQTGQNNMNQYLYRLQVQAAQANTLIARANASAQSQAAQGNLISGGATVGAAAASVAAAVALSCRVARTCYGELNPLFHQFRFGTMNLAPSARSALAKQICQLPYIEASGLDFGVTARRMRLRAR